MTHTATPGRNYLGAAWIGRAVAGLCPCVWLLAACASTACPSPTATSTMATESAPKPPGPIQRVVVVSVDGLMPDNYLHPEAHGLSVPILRWMVKQGAVSEGVQSVFPTLTYPSHTSLVTGVNPARHGIMSNRAFDPLDNELEAWRWYAEDIKSDPIWRLTEQRGYPTALLYWPVTVGAKVSWLLPEFWRAKTIQDLKLMRAVATPGLLDAVTKEYPDFPEHFVPPAVTDEALTNVALHVLSEGQPRLLMLHLIEVDGAQHHHGIDSPEAHSAIENDDRQLARLVARLGELKLMAETAFVVVSDHGFRAASKMVKPCTLLTDNGLVTVNDDGKVTDWRATAHSNSGSAYFYVKDATDTEVRDRVHQLVMARLAQPDSGIGRVYESEAIRERGGDPSAILAVEPADDYQFGPGCTGAYVAPAPYRATHGFDPDRPEMRASMLMVGPSIMHGKIAQARLIDLAPTIAQWLGIEMRGVDGAPLIVRGE
ncbi:MAG TPA: alkaline phosphatase family protein [Polyangiaceae bacterium]